MKNRRFKNRGFTLIEVLFAFLILATVIGGLIRLQTDSLRRATEGSLLITAAELARKKLVDCKYDLVNLNPSGSFGYADYNDDGDFSEEGFPDFSWTCEAPFLQIPFPNLDALSEKKSDSGSGSADPMVTAIGAIFSPLITAIGESARELVATVKWNRGSVAEEFKITTHVINREQFAKLVAAFPPIPGLGALPSPPVPKGGP